eukprot:1193695-Prorocentrum_minimum.AAC.2
MMVARQRSESLLVMHVNGIASRYALVYYRYKRCSGSASFPAVELLLSGERSACYSCSRHIYGTVMVQYCHGYCTPKLKTGRPSLISRVFRPFTFKVELDNAYHSNPDLINRTPEEARGVTRRKVTSEEYSQLRSAGSKCVAAWTQGDAYPLMPEWCRSKRTQVPRSLASWMRFVGDGNDGLFGYLNFLMKSAPSAIAGGAPIPGATAPPTCGCSDPHLLVQEVETQQAIIDDMKAEEARNREEITNAHAKLHAMKAKYEAVLKEVQYLRRINTILKKNHRRRTILKNCAKRLKRERLAYIF